MMPELLGRRTVLTVATATDGETVRPGHVYLLSPGKVMTYESGHIALVDKDPEVGIHLPIDRLFESLGRSCGPLGAGVVLSGTGRDGTAGAAVIDALGGVVLAESGSTAKFHGMPSSAIDAGVVSGIYPPDEMPVALSRFFDRATEGADDVATGVSGLFAEIRKRHDIDFSSYKTKTIFRRIDRRAEAAQLDREAYLARALKDPAEVDQLVTDFLVTVTRFFRDEDAFVRLAAEVESRMKATPEDEPFRAWVAGCATGEEAYSVGMILLETVETLGQKRDVKVFATDVNRHSLGVAARGEYDAEAMAQVSPKRMSAFFTKRGGVFKTKPELRRTVVFSAQDLLRDAPFTQLDLVTCRNVLIYLTPEAQERVLQSLHFGLREGGMLLLGPSETTRKLRELFSESDLRSQLFVKVPAPSSSMVPLGLGASVARSARSSRIGRTQQPLHDAMLARLAPPVLVIDAERRIVEALGGAERYLRVPAGGVDTDLLSLLHTDTTGAVAGALRALSRDDKSVELRRVRLGHGDEVELADLRLERLEPAGTSDRFTLVRIVSRESDDSGVTEDLTVASAAEREIDVLHVELERTREHLQTAVDDLEATNEALQAANEELLASNEELQTTNEELSSVNEELYTVNTEYQQSISELKETNGDLQQLLTTTRVATLFLDEGLRIRRFTALITEIMDIAESDKGRPITAFRHRLDWPDFYDRLAEVLETQAPLEHNAQDDEGRHFLIRVIPHESVATPGLVVTMTDVTALAEAQRKVFERQERLRRITNALPILIAYVDRDLRYQYANDSYLTLWDRTADELLGCHVTDVIGGHDTALAEMKGALEGERRQTVIDVLTPHGERTELVSYVPDTDDGDVVGIYIAATDITSRRAMERDLERARKEASEASQAKSEFIANMSHEIRTPMTAIMGHAELLSGKVGDDQLLRHVDTIRRNGRHLLTIIGDLLDLSQIEQGRLELKPEPFSPAALVWDVYDLFSVRAEERSLELVVDLPETLPDPIESDPARVKQILFNFVSNAVKFTPEGSVTIGIDVEDGDPAIMRFWVRDTGVGFPQAKAEAMFESFRQLDMSRTRLFEGTGLGLTISNQLAVMMGGRIVAKGVEGKGATFTFALPVGKLDAVRWTPTERRAVLPERAPTVVTPVRGRVLVVDDSGDVRELVAESLRSAGATVVALETGVAALDRVREHHDRREPFDVIIMDVHMPGLDGLETTRVLRRRGFDGPVVALTARAAPSDRQECLDAGCTEYLSKPVDLGALHACIAGLIAAETDAPPGVLIVDDSRDAAELLAEVLMAAGFEAKVAVSVEEALETWKAAPTPVIISDLNFDGEPRGLSLAEALRDRPEGPTLIAVSGAAELEDAARRAGFQHFLLKPFPMSELRDLITSTTRAAQSVSGAPSSASP